MFRPRKTIGFAVRESVAFLSERWTYRLTALFSFLFVAAAAFLPAWRLLPSARDAKFIPLHYNIYFGIDRFGPWYEMFVPAAVGLFILVVNIVVASRYFRSERLLSLFLCWLTVLFEAIIFSATFFIVLINV